MSKPSRIRDTLKRLKDPAGLLEAFFDFSPLSLQIYRKDGHSLLVNQAFLDLFGSAPPPEYVLFKDEILERQGFLKLIRRAFAGETVHVPAHWYDPRELKQVKVKTGNRVAIEATLFPLAHPGSKVEFVAIVFKDVTAAAQIQAERDRFHALIENTVDAIYLQDAEANILYASPSIEAVLGYTVEEQLALHPTKVLHPEDVERMRGEFQKVLDASGKVFRAEYRVRHKDGSYRWMEGTAKNMLDVPSVGAIVVTQHDISERKEALEQLENKVKERTRELEEANRELQAFVYSASHDLRAPARAIHGIGELILKKFVDSLHPEARDLIGRITERAYRMNQTVEGLLDLSKLSDEPLEKQRVDLSRLADELASGLRSEEPGRRVSFVIKKGLAADGDPRMLRTALENLLSNAWKFTARRKNARIEFGSLKRGGQRVFFVRDNGVGFEMKFADKLFDLFMRLHPVDEYAGLGIGLATVRRIVLRHVGRVWAEGVEDKGAAVYFTLA